jgi:hypothetical protein
VVARKANYSPLPSAHSPPPIPNHSHSKWKGSPGPAPRSEAVVSTHVAAAAPRINAERDTTQPPRAPPEKMPVPPRRFSAIPPDLGSGNPDSAPEAGAPGSGSNLLQSGANSGGSRRRGANRRRVPASRRPREESWLGPNTCRRFCDEEEEEGMDSG